MAKPWLMWILLSFIPLATVGCSDGGTPSAAASGGAKSSGGTSGKGGASGSGGVTASGGSSAGGSIGSGGRSGAGGSTGSGGKTVDAPATGGAAGGGTTGTVGNGGQTAVGGSAGKGGATAAGGTLGSGGTPSVDAGPPPSDARATGGATATGGTAGGGGAGTGGVAGRGGVAATGGSAKGGSNGSGGSVGTTNEVWVAPDGKDSNPGTKDSPMLNLCYQDSEASPAIKQGACEKLCPDGTGCPTTGGTIWVKGGTYKLSAKVSIVSSKNGTANGMINVKAEADATPEGANPAVLDFSGLPRAPSCDDGGTVGVTVNADYWHISGLTVIHASDNGFKIQGGYNILENCVAHDNEDFGIAIGNVGKTSNSGKNNQIINCDSYHNFDKICGGENADGFGAKKNSGTGNVFKGCRAWSDSDDGYDFYGWTSPITLENCWAFNIATESAYTGSNSDGNGFKLGSDSDDGAHKLSGCIAFGNKKSGFTSNGGKDSTCTNCKSCNNGQADKGVSGVSSGGCPTAAAAQAKRNADGSLPTI